MSVILVTGSSTGIGQETALHMARKGHDVYAAVRSPDTATELKEKIGAESLPVTVIKLDLVDPASIETAVKAIMQRSGRIDALVNNAGIGGGRCVGGGLVLVEECVRDVLDLLVGVGGDQEEPLTMLTVLPSEHLA